MVVTGIGIDLGTANTRVAIFRNGKAEIIPDVDGGDSFPSFAKFDSQSQTCLVGYKAKIQDSSPSSLVFGDIKRCLGKRPYGLNVEGAPIDNTERATPSNVEAVAAIFGHVMGNVARYCGLSLEIMTIQAVISVPALFNSHQRQVIRDAAKVVGIDVLSLITPSSAICFAWAHSDRQVRTCQKAAGIIHNLRMFIDRYTGLPYTDSRVHEPRILTLDIGAGFLHVAVASISFATVQMRFTNHKKLGGYDLENALYNHLAVNAKIKGIQLDSNSRAKCRLRNACQKAIVWLSSAQEYHFVLEADDKTFDIKIDRAMLDELARKTFLSTVRAAIDKALRRSDTQRTQIEEVVTTGGCSRIPYLQRLLEEYFSPMLTRIRPRGHAEVIGCAMYSATFHLSPSNTKGFIWVPSLFDSMPLPIRLGPQSGACLPFVADNLATSDATIPHKHTKVIIWDNLLGFCNQWEWPLRAIPKSRGSTRERTADKVVCLYQGNSRMCRENSLLMRVDLTDALSESPDGEARRLEIVVELNFGNGSNITVSVTTASGLTTINHLDLNQRRLMATEREKPKINLERYRANDKLRQIGSATGHALDEELVDGPSDSTPLQPPEDINYAATFSNDHLSAPVGEQQVTLTMDDPLTEMPVQYSEQIAEQVESASLELKAERLQNYTTDRPRDEDITVTPGQDHLLADDSYCDVRESDEAHHTDEQPQDEYRDFRSTVQQIHFVPSSSVNVARPSVRTTVELESLFSTSSRGRRGIYTDVNFARVSVYLRNTGNASWSATPRLYTALRLVNHVEALDGFLELGMNDMCFPFTDTTIPTTISPTIKSAFLEVQDTVYSESKSYDVGHGKHVYFAKDDPKPFQTIALLGKGGHGTVDKVMSHLDQMEYARKLFRRVRGWSQSHIESFRTEVNVLKRVDHIHCVQLINTYSDPRYFALLMAPAGDCNLARFYELAQNNDDKLSLLRGFMGCLTSGVRYLHDSKIRHRDIKPQNVIVKDHQVYLTDFGIAYSWESLAGATTTADSGKTASYAAPEVIRVEARSTSADVWSLGCIFFEIATVLSGGSVGDLKAYFRQKTDTEAYHANVDHFQAWASDLRSGSANNVDSFSWKVARMALQVDPENRLTAAALFEEIAEETHRVGVHFCGPCCLDEDTSTIGSEAGSVDESWP